MSACGCGRRLATRIEIGGRHGGSESRQESNTFNKRLKNWMSLLRGTESGTVYNNGKLHGRWIDATQGESAIRDEIQEMLSESPEPNAEEWAIHDYEGFGQIRLSESEDIAPNRQPSDLHAQRQRCRTRPRASSASPESLNG